MCNAINDNATPHGVDDAAINDNATPNGVDDAKYCHHLQSAIKWCHNVTYIDAH